MKKGKLLFLLAAVLSLTILFVACDQTGLEAPDESGTQTETGTNADTVENNEEATIGEIATEQETVKHEIHNYFDLVADKKDQIFTEVQRLEGEIVSVDSDNNLAVIRTKDLSNDNMVEETVTVYNLLTGEEILVQSVSNAYKADSEDLVELSVTVNYPVIRVCYKSCEEKDGNLEYSYEVSYYQAKKDGELIHTTTDENYDRTYFGNGLVRVVMGDKTFWIDRDGDVVRSVETIAASGYDTQYVRSEYKGYIYSWNPEELLIFNRSGIVSGRYLAGEDSTIDVNVLNNGNALIQEFTEVGLYDSCDFVLEGVRYVMKSSIMNFITGETTEIELDKIVYYIETKYEQECQNIDTLVLAKGSENYGYVYNVANGSVAVSAELCVFDNDFNVIYTLKNDTFGLVLEYGVYPISDLFYIAAVNSGGYEHYELFDLEGNALSNFRPTSYMYGMGITDKYIVTSDVIYDHKMTPVYNIVESGYTYEGIVNNNIYLTKTNFVSGGIETYVITSESKAPELFADGLGFEVVDVGTGYYILKDVENDVYRLYNGEGVELITSHEALSAYSYYVNEDVAIISTTFNGENVVYILK